jgi:hypothetical protein
MFTCEFFLDFLSNSLATILGLVVGIPIAFYVDRRIKSKKIDEDEKEDCEKSEEILARVLLQITNAELKLNSLSNLAAKEYLINLFIPQVDVIESLHNELTELNANWEVLLSMDIVISDFRAMNNLLDVHRNLFNLMMEEKISSMSSYYREWEGEMNYLLTITIDGIKDFRKILFEHYPNVIDQFDKH